MNGPSRSVLRAGKAIGTKPTPTFGAGTAAEPISIRTGYVVTVDGTLPPSCTVTFGASQVNIPGMRYDKSYMPVGGEEVKIIRIGDDHWIIGALAT